MRRAVGTDGPLSQRASALVEIQGRGLATVQSGMPASESRQQTKADAFTVDPDDRGPMMEYDDRVATGRLRDDEHQRGTDYGEITFPKD